jgi:nucleoside-diphosphate-sugar epimerase
VGAQIVLNLVDHGYTVRCCVRDADNPLKTSHLLAMNSYGAPGKLTLHTADLLTPGDYDAVFAGCAAVFHVAAVLERDHQGGGQGSGDVTQREVYDGGFLATQNVLDSVKKSGSVKRIIYTSSVAGVVGGRPADHVYTEADWADHGDLSGPKKELAYDYGRSKADTERLLYSEAAADGSFDVISHNPWHVLGPIMCQAHFEIWQYRVSGLVQGDALEPDMYSIIDTRDIATCARLSAESTMVTNGTRFLMVGTRGTSPIRIKDLQTMLQSMYPDVQVAGETEGEFTERAMAGDTALARNLLGMEFHSLQDTLRATIDSAIEMGYIKPAGKVTHQLMRWHNRLQPLLVNGGKM